MHIWRIKVAIEGMNFGVRTGFTESLNVFFTMFPVFRHVSVLFPFSYQQVFRHTPI